MSRESAVEAGLQQPGWRFPEDLAMLWDLTVEVAPAAHVVEVGCFLGRTTAVLADARREVRAGPVTAVDPLDGRGEPFSIPFYEALLAAEGGRSQRAAVTDAVAALGLEPWVDLVELTAEEAGARWAGEVGLLLLDGDQSPSGAAAAFSAWEQHLAPGAVVVVGNSAVREYAPGHDGNALLLGRCVSSGRYELVHRGDTSVLRLRSG